MKHPAIAIVVAMTRNRIIGRDNKLPWNLPTDLARFRTITMGKPMIMGRRTHESIGRALAGRRNVVLSHRADFRASECCVVSSFEAALKATSSATEIMIIGGTSIYRQALNRATRIYLTLVHTSIAGDSRFPDITPDAWREISHIECSADSHDDYDMSFIELVRTTTAR